MQNQTINVFLAGVGGQGLVLVNRLLVRAAVLSGLDAKCTDTHGLAMRGGGVMGTLRIGAKVGTSIFAPGEGDFLLGLEPLEALRWSHMLKKGGTVVVSTDQLRPTLILLEQLPFPTDWRDVLSKAGLKIKELSGAELALAAGDYRMINVVMAGAISACLPLDFEKLKEALRASVPEGTFDKNLTALIAGRESCR